MQQQIHNVIVRYHDRYVVDPELGPVKRREQVLKASDVDRIVHEGETYEVQPDGSFVVPELVAAHMLRMPGWYEGPSPFAVEIPQAQVKQPAAEPRKPQPAPAPAPEPAPSAPSAPTS